MYHQKSLQAEQVLEEEHGLLDVERDHFVEIHWLVILRLVTYLKMLLLIYIGDLSAVSPKIFKNVVVIL